MLNLLFLFPRHSHSGFSEKRCFHVAALVPKKLDRGLADSFLKLNCRKSLNARTVTANKDYAAGTVPANKEYAAGTL